MGRFFKNFFYGMGSVMDLGGTSFRTQHPLKDIRLGSPADDAAALRGDFEKVGNDMRKAMLFIDEEAQGAAHPRIESVR